MRFIRDEFRHYTADDFRCFENIVSATERSSSELFRQGVNEVVQTLLGQLCWSFWQSREDYPAEEMRQYVAGVIAEMRL